MGRDVPANSTFKTIESSNKANEWWGKNIISCWTFNFDASCKFYQYLFVSCYHFEVFLVQNGGLYVDGEKLPRLVYVSRENWCNECTGL